MISSIKNTTTDSTTATTTTTTNTDTNAKRDEMTSLKHKSKQQEKQKPAVISSFQLYQKPKQLTPQRCERIVKYARKRLRGEDNNSVDAADNSTITGKTVPVLTHSQIELGRVLGKGAFSSVYEIKSIIKKEDEQDDLDERDEEEQDEQEDQIVVKFLRSKLYDNHGLFAASAADLVKEGNILSTLCHTNVIRLHAVSSLCGVAAYLNGYHDGYFLVLERLECTLADRINDWKFCHKELYETDEQQAQLLLQQQQEAAAAFVSRSSYTSASSTTSWRKKLSASFRSSKSKSESLEISERTTATNATYYTSTSSDGGSDSRDDDDDFDDFGNDNEDEIALAAAKFAKTSLLDERLDVVLQLADAIVYLHKQNVLHRDLKPDNIGFDKDGVLKVFDFDIARVVPSSKLSSRAAAEEGEEDSAIFQSSSHSANIKKPENETFRMTQKVGSPRYMSPECARQEPYNLKADVYSYALLAHQVLTLEKPYDDISDEDHDELVFYKGVRPKLPSDLPKKTKDLLKKAWSHTISERPTMKKLRRVLAKERPEILRLGTEAATTTTTTIDERTMPYDASASLPINKAYVSSCSFTASSDNSKKIKIKSDIKKSKSKNKGSSNSPKKNKEKRLLSMFRRNKNVKKLPHDPEHHHVSSRFQRKLTVTNLAKAA